MNIESPVLNMIINWIENLIPLQGYIDRAYDFVSGLSYLEQLIGMIVFGIVVIVGLIGLVKLLSKLIIIAAILFGVWLLYTNGVFG